MVGICTNAFTKKLVPEMELVPGRGQVLVTAPIPKLKIKGVFHYDEGYFYFRNFGNRVILGGGRNRDFDTETSTDFNINKKILNTLVQQLEEVILPEQAFHIEQVWTGIMAFGPNKQPICRRYSPRIALGVRLGGMGVAIGSQIGRQLAELLTGDNI
jgi:glycine/D-amino acid oxidase-like deaminating enzyme